MVLEPFIMNYISFVEKTLNMVFSGENMTDTRFIVECVIVINSELDFLARYWLGVSQANIIEDWM